MCYAKFRRHLYPRCGLAVCAVPGAWPGQGCLCWPVWAHCIVPRLMLIPATSHNQPQQTRGHKHGDIPNNYQKVGFAKMTNAGPCLQPPSSPTFCSGLSPLMRPPMLTVLPRKSKTPTAPPPPPTKSPPPPTRSPPTPRPPLLRPTEPPPPPPSTPMARPPPRPCPPTQRRPTLLPATNHHLSSVTLQAASWSSSRPSPAPSLSWMRAADSCQ